jgi:hypothetical protein
MTDLAAAATVADALRSPTARDAALDALEALPLPIADDVALAAAPALVDVVAGAAEETERAAFDRAALLLGRLLVEAAPDPAPVFGAAFAGERVAAYHGAQLVAEATQRALSGGEALTRADALSYACTSVFYTYNVCGYTLPLAAIGYTMLEYMRVVSFLLRSPLRAGSGLIASC